MGKRKFLTVELNEQKAEEISARLYEFLSKKNIESGKAINEAKNISQSKQRDLQIMETLPKAWNKIISDPDDLFVEILSETTEKICGFKPNIETLESFVKEIQSKFLLKNNSSQKKKQAQIKKGKDDSSWKPHEKGRRFLLKYKGLSAIGINNGNSITILKGSQATNVILDSLKNHYIVMRNNLIASGILSEGDDSLIFESDYNFESFSAAASIICGSSRNGKKDFKKL